MANLEDLFPRLRGAVYELTSPEDIRYNCVAWTVGDTDRWWWPDDDSHWPEGLAREETLAAFIAAYAQLGFEPCDDAVLQDDYQKIAIYATPDGVPSHAAKQTENGMWSSKLGQLEDIAHGLEDLVGERYGDVIQILSRRKFRDS